ncbi:flagellar biosynthesis regulator FlaF [Shimia haliotis]|uniref:Flagellar protein FlaF n=1 Tax=Shimia haliotis TaxID=1280847 RepID=A0A1I4DFI4_9RHOB|nr:flagellar biosynthesis regulator FlaF [Shimia haliotis]SFK90896.1 flagellar protein FlaF [Shimia haliotis]
MNAAIDARNAYRSAQSSTRSFKETEYELLGKLTQRMISSTKQGKSGFAALADALHANRRLWSTFSVDLANENNPMPKQLKEQLIYLSEFTRQHTSKVLSGKANVAPLVEINTAVMRGLRGGAKK